MHYIFRPDLVPEPMVSLEQLNLLNVSKREREIALCVATLQKSPLVGRNESGKILI